MTTKRARKRTVRPVLRRPRNRSRGKPFQKGNSFGLSTRFRPGQSGNPGGRPSSAKVGNATRVLLGLKTSEPIPRGTNAEELTLKLFRLAKKGNLSAIRELIDRAEGRPPQAVSIEDNTRDPLTLLVEQMQEFGRQRYGRPEGMPIRKAENAE